MKQFFENNAQKEGNEGTSIIIEDKKIPVEPEKLVSFSPFLSKARIAFVDSGIQEMSEGIFLLKCHAGIWEENKKIKGLHAELFFRAHDSETHLLKSGTTENREFSEGLAKSLDKENILESIERNAIDFLIDHIGAGNLIVRDGSFDSPIFEQVIEKSRKGQVLLMALSKSSSIKTNFGEPAVNYLYNLSRKFKNQDECWYYRILETQRANIAFVKLNSLSEFIFRLDIAGISGIDMKHAIQIIASGAIDPVFIGYPYGLIDADQNARVTNEISEFYKMKLRLEFGLDIRMKNENAHSILDKIRF